MSDNIRQVDLTWQGGLRFRGGKPGGPVLEIDGDVVSGPGPMHTLLLAVGTCSGSDVALILAKMRVQLSKFEMAVKGVRRTEDPKRYVSIHLDYRLSGAGLDETRARRAIDLSIERYCSVIHSLNPDIPITYDVVIEPAGPGAAAS
ncbi:MAG TPA: OsmC family protein [Gemmatimonadales bacterium]|nr:OsmC family protein [Gemmatimonadales bacterium]